jgi:hypothetical protein
MKSRSSSPRSYLQRLAEPIPRASTPLLPRKPVNGHSKTSQSIVPAIVDSVNRTSGEPPASTVQSAFRKTASPAAGTSRLHPLRTASFPSRSQTAHTQPLHSLIAETVLTAASSPGITSEATGIRLTPESLAAMLPSRRPQPEASSSTQPNQFASTSLLSPVPPPSTHALPRPQSRRDIKVHIGTIEVRVPPPPSRKQQPVSAIDRGIRTASSSRTPAAPLARGLGWSHGLVQG